MARTKKSSATANSAANDNSVADFLKSAAQNTTEKKASKTPVVTGSEAMSDKLATLYREYKTAEGVYQAEEEIFLKAARAEYQQRSERGEHTKSMNYAGSTTGGVQVVFTDRFCALDANQEVGLRQELGANFDRFFEQRREISIKTPSDSTIQLLLEKLGPEQFRQIFDVKLTLVAKSDMDRNQFQIPEEVRTLSGIKQFKPAVKVIK